MMINLLSFSANFRFKYPSGFWANQKLSCLNWVHQLDVELGKTWGYCFTYIHSIYIRKEIHTTSISANPHCVICFFIKLTQSFSVMALSCVPITYISYGCAYIFWSTTIPRPWHCNHVHIFWAGGLSPEMGEKKNDTVSIINVESLKKMDNDDKDDGCKVMTI